MLINILLFAQDIVTEGSKQMPVTSAGTEISFFSLLLKGGYILFPILILSFITVFLIIQKSFFLKENLKIDSAAIEYLNENIRKGNIDAANEYLNGQTSSFARIYQKALPKIGKPVKEIESTIESASNIEVSRLSKNMGYLGLIAGIAPMLGFIGTISGIIKIFYNISLTDNISIGIISGGLYEKMISSGSGLIVGVIAFTGYHMLNMSITKFIAKVEVEAFELLNILSK
jgi:biopolymer transport protein ExbB